MGPKESPALEAAILGLMVLMSVTSYGELSPYAFLLLAASDILERKFLIIYFSIVLTGYVIELHTSAYIGKNLVLAFYIFKKYQARRFEHINKTINNPLKKQKGNSRLQKLLSKILLIASIATLALAYYRIIDATHLEYAKKIEEQAFLLVGMFIVSAQHEKLLFIFIGFVAYLAILKMLLVSNFVWWISLSVLLAMILLSLIPALRTKTD